MPDLIKEAKKMAKNIDMKKAKSSAKKVGDIVKDKKITKEEKEELKNLAKDFLKDLKD
jgi:hypothetical protein